MSELLELCKSKNLSLGALQETINTLGPRLSSQNPSCVHKACGSKNATLEIVQLLYNIWPGALRLRDNDYGRLPIHYLCRNEDLDDTNSLDILRFMLNIDPTLPRETNNGYLPVHLAVRCKSTAFCKELINAYPESLRIDPGDGRLPIHFACAHGKRDDTVDTIQYMLEMNLELINAEDNGGYLPIHWAIRRTESIELLLKFDPGAASKEINNGSRTLPLHLACDVYYTNLSSIQALYDAYPEAILATWFN